MTPDRCQLAGHEYEPAASCRACAAERLADTEADTAPQRPAPPPAEITATAERHRAQTAAGRSTGRDFAQPTELALPDGSGVRTCSRPTCRARYVDTPAGRTAHRTVFAHDAQ